MGQTHRHSSRLAALGLLLTSPLLTAAAAATGAQDDTDGLSERWYDIRGIVRSKTSGTLPVDTRLPLEAAFLDRLEVERGPLQHPILNLDEGAVGDFVEQAILQSPEAKVERRRDLGGKLLLSANAEGHRIAQSILQSAARWSQAGARVEVFEVPADALHPDFGSVLTGAAAEALLAGGQTKSHGQSFLRFGENRALGNEASTNYVHDYDVEVASGAVAADLSVSSVRTGARVGLRAELTRDKKHIVLRAFGRRSSLDAPMRRITLPAFAGSELELPALDVALFSCSGKLGVGDAMVMHAGDPSAPAIVARVIALDAPKSDAGLTGSALLFGDMFLGNRRRDPAYIPFAQPSYGSPRTKVSLAELSAPWSVNEIPIATDARDFVNEVLGEPGLANEILSLGNIGIFAGDPSQLTGLRAQLDSLSVGLTRPTIDIEVAYCTLDPSSDVALDGPADYARLAAADGTRRLRGACLEGDTLQLAGGRNAAYLQDHDCQIAGGSSIMDPILRHTFEGFSFWCSPMAMVDGPVSAWVDFKFVERAPAPRTGMAARFSYPSRSMSQQERAFGKFHLDLPIELPETRHASVNANLPSIGQEWSLLATESIAGSDKRFVAVIRATVR